MSDAPPKVYVIVRQWWNYNDEWTEHDEAPLKAFAARDQAEAFLARCRVRAREERLDYVQGGVGYAIVEVDRPAVAPGAPAG